MLMRYGQADIPQDALGLAAADFPRDVCLTVSRNHKVYLLYSFEYQIVFKFQGIL